MKYVKSEDFLYYFDIHEISIVRVDVYNEIQAYDRIFEELKIYLNKNSDKYKCNKNKIKVYKVQ